MASRKPWRCSLSIGVHVSAQAHQESSHAAKLGAVIFDVAGQDLVLGVVHVVTQIDRNAGEALDQFTDQLFEEFEGIGRDLFGGQMLPQAVDARETVLTAREHQIAADVNAQHAEAVGIRVEVVMQITQHDNERIRKGLQVDPHAWLHQRCARLFGDRQAMLEKRPRPVVA
jgi:hypothetical protein